MVMRVCVDIAPGMYLCVLHVLMVCSCMFLVLYSGINHMGGPSLCETGTYIVYMLVFVLYVISESD